ncbi:MAG: hypothetical protein LBI72_07720 [Flavobacteriaceae bacterium]|jgi:hypothetical protein|nr:hypothetical protein [Flavobacteriaceae bacterium]
MKENSSLISGTLTGTTFTLLPLIDWTDVIKTVILAALGALVSCVVSVLIQKIKGQK